MDKYISLLYTLMVIMGFQIPEGNLLMRTPYCLSLFSMETNSKQTACNLHFFVFITIKGCTSDFSPKLAFICDYTLLVVLFYISWWCSVVFVNI